MRNSFLLLGIFLILINCEGLEFVYKTNINTFFIKNNTQLVVNGDDSSQIRSVLSELIGDTNNDFPKYKLIVSSAKTEIAEVIKKDATASKFNIRFSIKYDLYNLDKNCKLYDTEIKTISRYNVKSAGYSFGTDLSQKESTAQNINKNINNFIYSLNKIQNHNSCIK